MMDPDGPAVERKPIRVMLVDDHPAVREGVALLLKLEGVTICGDASGISEALDSISNCMPDMVLLDLSLDGEDGLSLVSRLHGLSIPTLIYSMYEDAIHVEGAFSAGALGYVTKREIHSVLMQAIREVSAGRRFVSPNAALALAEWAAEPFHADRVLSDQEQNVYDLLGKGEGTIEIAAALKISTRTVESYYTRIQDKLGLEGMRDLRRHAITHVRTNNS